MALVPYDPPVPPSPLDLGLDSISLSRSSGFLEYTRNSFDGLETFCVILGYRSSPQQLDYIAQQARMAVDRSLYRPAEFPQDMLPERESIVARLLHLPTPADRRMRYRALLEQSLAAATGQDREILGL